MISSLKDNFSCPTCLEPLRSAVSLNPCGHELNESCAQAVLELPNKQCPICLVCVDSFRPAYVTRNAVAIVFQEAKPSGSVEIKVKSITGRAATFYMNKDDKIAKLFPLIRQEFHMSHVELTQKNKHVSPFKIVNDYFLEDGDRISFAATEDLSHWSQKAPKHPEILRKAYQMLRINKESSDDRKEQAVMNFLKLYREELQKAMQ